MTTDTKAVARLEIGYGGEFNTDPEMTQTDDGDYVLFTDHERVVKDVWEVTREIQLQSDKYWNELRQLRATLEANYCEVEGLRDALAASRAKVEGLKKDAERYRFLRSAGGAATLRFHNTNPANRDAAIDASMEK